MTKLLLSLLCSFVMVNSQADTIDHYMNIATNIPKMEMKADAQSQAWARSARTVLLITAESIAETLTQANEFARSQGKPLFCLPQGKKLEPTELNELIVQTYRGISSQQSDKDKMTISQVAWLAVSKQYPCNGNALRTIGQNNASTAPTQHMTTALGLANP